MSTRKMSDFKTNFAGGGRDSEIFPDSVHVKKMKSVEGAGEINDYPDLENDVSSYQDKGIGMAEKAKLKAGFRY